jgi:drug/metabolite transporter (DMT)-like permease
MAHPAARPSMVISALITVQVLFGVNYVISKIIVDAFPPLVWAFARVMIAAAILFGFAFALRPEKRPPWSWKYFGPLIVFTLLGTVINQGSFLVGLHHTTAVNSAVLNTLIPIFTLIVVTLRGQERLSKTRATGFICAFIGVGVLLQIEHFSFSSVTAYGDFLTILNCASYALFLSYSKQFIEKYDRLWTTTWFFAYGTVGFFLLSANDLGDFSMPQMTTELVLALVFAVIGGTILTYFLNIWALAHTTASQVAVFIYIQPIVAALLAWFWKGQPITLRTIFASILIFAGVLLSSVYHKKK